VTSRIRPRLAATRTLLALALLAGSSGLRAATYDVDSPIDSIDAAPGDRACADASGLCSLRAAVMEGNTDGVATVIRLPSGTFSISIAGAGEDLCASGDLDVLAPTTILGSGALATFIDGGGVDRLFDVAMIGNVRVESLTLMAGDAGSEDGGGLRAREGASVTGVGVAVRSCRAASGGGLHVAGDLSLESCVLAANRATADGGGAWSGVVVAMADCTVEDNEAGLVGGGIHVVTHDPTPSDIERCVVRRNTARIGGGMAFDQPLAYGSRLVFVEDSVIEANVAEELGGGVAILAGTGGRESLNVILERSTLSGNVALRGSAVAVTGCAGTDWAGVSLVETTASGNRALDAGAVAVEQDCSGRLAGATITANTGLLSVGGLFSDGGDLTIENSIVAANVGGSGSGDCSGTIQSRGYNLLGDVTGCTILGDAATVLTGTDPMLEPLQDNGGFTLTHALHASSPAIDRGNPAACAGCTDQRGLARIADGDGVDGVRRDIGAVEAASGVDADGDGIYDANESPCGPWPTEPRILVRWSPSAMLASLSWSDTTIPSGSETQYDIASDDLSSLARARAATAPCVTRALPALAWTEPVPSTGLSRYFLVRSRNACGAEPGAWGSTSLGTVRPTCP
jgi:hypothetical protein